MGRSVLKDSHDLFYFFLSIKCKLPYDWSRSKVQWQLNVFPCIFFFINILKSRINHQSMAFSISGWENLHWACFLCDLVDGSSLFQEASSVLPELRSMNENLRRRKCNSFRESCLQTGLLKQTDAVVLTSAFDVCVEHRP